MDPSQPISTESARFLTRASLFQNLRQPERRARELAWVEFRNRYAPIVAGFAAKCGASRQDIDDIVQDVMTGFIGAEETFVYDPAKGRFRGWLKTCAVRAAIRRAGKNLRFRGKPLDEIPQAELAVEPVWNDVWEEQLVAQALEIVREETNNSLAFRAFEQYVLRDRAAEVVAAELNTSIDNVHQAKTRITAKLRQAVQRLREEEG